MMEKIDPSRAQRICSPAPFALAVTRKEDGRMNIAAFSWWTFASNRPPTLLLCTANKGLTGENIRREGRFVLCVPGPGMEEKSMLCGKNSGRSVDKADAFGIEFIPCGTEGDLAAVGSRLAFVCSLSDTASVSDHTIYIARIEAVYEDSALSGHLMAVNGYSAVALY